MRFVAERPLASSSRWQRLLRESSTPAIVDAEGREVPGSIATVESVSIDGSEQWVSIRGRDVSNPLMVFVCGGPCASEMALIRHYVPTLEDHFTIVMWDHRGAAKSFGALRHAAPTLDRHVEDLHELVEQMTRRFQARRAFIVAHSWGSVPGLEFVRRHPSLVHAYVGIGQIVNVREGHHLAYTRSLELARQAGHRVASWLMETIGPPPYRGRLLRMVKHWTMVQSALAQGAAKKVVREMAQVSWNAPEYSWIDKANFVRALTLGLAETLPHTESLNFEESALRVDAPMYFALGRHDVLTPPDLVERYIARLEAPRKKIIWFESAAHLPPYEEPERFVDAMVNEVLRETMG